MQFDIAQLRSFRLSALAMARGEHSVEQVEDGQVVAFVIVYGAVQITRERGGQPASFSLHATPRKPLFLVNPGTYCVVARDNVLGFRGARRRGVTL
jgi:hypothetical protein